MKRDSLSFVNSARFFARAANRTSIDPHLLEERRVAVAVAFSQWMGESLAPVALGFAWLYLFFGFAHLAVLHAPISWLMSGTAFGTTALMMVLQARWRYAQPQGAMGPRRRRRDCRSHWVE